MNSQTRKVSECAEVLPGYALKVRAEHEPEGSHFILMAKDLKETACISFDEKNHDILKMTVDKNIDRYLLKKGDVVFISRGARNESAVIGDVPVNTIASSIFYILRPDKETNPHYLAWCMNQFHVLGRLDQIRTGAGTPIIQRQNLKDMAIPVPPMEEQRSIAKLAELMNEEFQVQKALLDNTQNMHRIINSRLLTEQLKSNK